MDTFQAQFGVGDSAPPLEVFAPVVHSGLTPQEMGLGYVDIYTIQEEALPSAPVVRVSDFVEVDMQSEPSRKSTFGSLTARIFRGSAPVERLETPRWRRNMIEAQRLREKSGRAGATMSFDEDITNVASMTVVVRPMEATPRFVDNLVKFYITVTINGAVFLVNMLSIDELTLVRFFQGVVEKMRNSGVKGFVIQAYLEYSNYYVVDDPVQIGRDQTNVFRKPEEMTGEPKRLIYRIECEEAVSEVRALFANNVQCCGSVVYDVPVVIIHNTEGDRCHVHLLTGQSDCSGWHLRPAEFHEVVDTTVPMNGVLCFGEKNAWSSQKRGGVRYKKSTSDKFRVEQPPFDRSKLMLSKRS